MTASIYLKSALNFVKIAKFDFWLPIPNLNINFAKKENNKPSSTMKMETKYLSETLVSTYEYIGHHNPEKRRHLHRRGNTKSQTDL